MDSVKIKSIKIVQPVGDFFVGVMQSSDLCAIAVADVRRVSEEKGFETYLGIQRELNPKRVKEISQYVNTPDACFPTAIILAVPAECAEYNEQKGELTLRAHEDKESLERSIPLSEIATIIDGQHRIAGLKEFKGDCFDINVCVFVDMDTADQAYLFSTVNLAQTKVNKSLVYDLYELAKHRSPQKTCHNIAVALDKTGKSPFYKRVKRLGVSTEGRFNETITQATFVEALIKYISANPLRDRALLLGNKRIPLATADELNKMVFRNMFLQEKDADIVDILWNYFDAVKQRWPSAWDNMGHGHILNKTNGFKALMRFFRDAYLYLSEPGKVPSTKDFQSVFSRVKVKDDHFNTDNFKPGTEGEAKLYNFLNEQADLK